MSIAATLRWTVVGALSLMSVTAAHAPQRELRVCADPNNLPFSNARGEGFENKIAELVAKDIGAQVKYTWFAQRRGFVRNTLKAGDCDLVVGVPASFDLTAVTVPYYRSSYVFVSRRDRGLAIRSFDDPRLSHLRIGVQLVGDDGMNTPPVHALANRGIRGNLKGYLVTGDYSKPNPPARIIDGVANGEVDVAIVWGPLAGYFAHDQPVALEIAPVSPQIDLPFLPEVFDISMGVRREDKEFREQLDSIIQKRMPEIDAILDAYHVPRLGSRA